MYSWNFNSKTKHSTASAYFVYANAGISCRVYILTEWMEIRIWDGILWKQKSTQHTEGIIAGLVDIKWVMNLHRVHPLKNGLN